MSVAAGPEIANDGLVFAYDISNTLKSWKGAPTTNLATGQTLLNHSLVTLPTFSDAPERGAGWKKVIVTATSSNFRMLKMDAFSVAANSTTTYSIEFECSSPEVYLNIDGTGFGGGAWTKIGATRYSRTVTTASAGQAYLFVNSNNLNASVNYIIYYKEYQIENNSFATPFVNGTRSTTQSIVDLTGLNTVTATSLTYASNNTFSFNGTSNYVDSGAIALTGTSSQSLTWACWVKSAAATGDIINMVYPTSGWNMCPIYASGQQFYSKVWSNASMAAGQTFVLNQYYYLVLVRNNLTNTNSFYVNGALVASQVGAYSSSGNPNNHYFGRAGSQASNTYFNGYIPAAQIYNRALSATEIQQNFYATRGRYGI